MKSRLHARAAFPAACFLAALCLPSFTLVWPSRGENLRQIGIQSLLDPPIGAAWVANLLFAIVLWMLLRSRQPVKGIRLAGLLLIGVAGCVQTGAMMGDPMPGMTQLFGPGAWLWSLAMLSAGFGALRVRQHPLTPTTEFA